MPTVSSFQPLFDVINKSRVFLARPPVQLQLIAIVVVLIAAGVLSILIWRQYGGRLQQWVIQCRYPRLRSTLYLLVAQARSLSFPIFGWGLPGVCSALRPL